MLTGERERERERERAQFVNLIVREKFPKDYDKVDNNNIVIQLTILQQHRWLSNN